MPKYRWYNGERLRQTENRDLYYAEVERIRAIIRKYEKDDKVIAVHFEFPERPSRIMMSDIEELMEINEYDIEQTIEYDETYDDKLPTFDEAEAMTQNFLSFCDAPGNERFSKFMRRWVEHLQQTTDGGKRRIGKMFNDAMEQGLIMESKVRYKLEACISFMSEILDSLPEISQTEKLLIMDNFEAEEEWAAIYYD